MRSALFYNTDIVNTVIMRVYSADKSRDKCLHKKCAMLLENQSESI